MPPGGDVRKLARLGLGFLLGGQIQPLLAEIEQAGLVLLTDRERVALHPQEKKGENLQRKARKLARKLPSKNSVESVDDERGELLDSQSSGRKMGKAWYRGAAGAFALTICLGASPIWAGQNQPDAPQEAVQQSTEDATRDYPSQGPPPAYQEVPRSLTLRAGTVISVRTSQLLSSDQNRPGDGFSAELQQPLVVDGWVVARRGQTVLGRVAVAQKAGRVKGVSQLGVELSQLVLVDGQQLPIRTQLMQASGGTTQARDATGVGTSTGIGAAIGAAANGGAGAGIGAAIGAGAGLAGVLLTRGRPTVIPPEAQLTFQLESPVTFTTQRSTPAFRPVNQDDYGSETLHRRTERFALAPYPPPPPPYWGYGPWGYYYPPPVFFGFYRFGGRGFHHRRW